MLRRCEVEVLLRHDLGEWLGQENDPIGPFETAGLFLPCHNRIIPFVPGARERINPRLLYPSVGATCPVRKLELAGQFHPNASSQWAYMIPSSASDVLFL